MENFKLYNFIKLIVNLINKSNTRGSKMNKKNILSLTLGAFIIASGISGCGKDENISQSPSEIPQTSGDTVLPSSEVKGEITFVNHRTDMMNGKWEEYAKKFNEKYPNVKVKFEAMADYEGEIAIRMNSNNYGDVLMMPAKMKDSDLPSFFIPLGKKSDLEKEYNFVQDRYVGEDTYGIPTAGSCSGLVYNKKIFEQAGITSLPKSPEEFIADLKLIKEKTSAIPLYTNYKDSWALNQWESYRVNTSGDPNFVNQVLPHTDKPFTKGSPHYLVYKLLYDAVKEKLVEKDPMTTDWESSKQMLPDGKIATMPLGIWAVGQMKAKAKNPEDVCYMPFPYEKDGKMYSSAAGDYKICVNKNSKNIEAAKAWLWWFVNDSNFAYNESMIPPLKDAEYPDTLKEFQKMNVELVVDNGPKDGENGWLDAIDKESEVGLWAENFKKDIVETALGNKKNRNYDDIMEELNKKWSDTRKKLIHESKIKE
jgi:ABC-type glycerol-3-phosphate transport system substrate-binding protein